MSTSKSSKAPKRSDALRALAALAAARPNDCARLALEEEPPVQELDLTLLQEIRRGTGGSIEVRLVDRLRALELLTALLEQDPAGAEAFFSQLESAAKS